MRSPSGGIRSGLLVLFAALSLVLASSGNLLGNVVAEQVPTEWRNRAPSLLILTVVLYLVVNVSLARVQDALGANWRRALNRRLQLVRLMLLLFDAVLAAFGGLLSNLAADSLLPSSLAPYAPLLYSGVVVSALAMSLFLYWLQRLPASRQIDRAELLVRLRDRYEVARAAALQGDPAISVKIAWTNEGVAVPVSPNETAAAHSALLPFFDNGGGRLLLLGQPGAGKSILMAELGLDLLRRAHEDQKRPIPVIFPVSTWAINQKSILDWLVETLMGPPNSLSERQARNWINAGAILPLLDGLDEVDDIDLREACVYKINEYCAVHHVAPFVVTSRATDYLNLKVQLALPRAIAEPLSDAQVIAYLKQAGAGYQALCTAVEQNSSLRNILKTLLFLRVAMRAYHDLEPSSIPEVSDQAKWIRQLFRDYTAQMLSHRSESEEPNALYRQVKVTAYLGWLAEMLTAHRLTEFFIENLNPTWLPPGPPQARYRRNRRFIGAIAAFFWLGPLAALPVAGALAVFWELTRLGNLFWPHSQLGPVYNFTAKWWGAAAISSALVAWLATTVLYGLFLDFSWDDESDSDPGVEESMAVVLGVLIGAIVGSAYSSSAHTAGGVIAGGLYGIFALMMSGCAVLILVGIPLYFVEAVEDLPDLLILPGAIFVLGVLALEIAALTYAYGMLPEAVPAIVVVLVICFSVGVAGGLYIIGITCRLLFARIFLRRQLQRAELAPPRYIRFLNFCSEHALLQKVGRGYRFYHPLLQEFFMESRSNHQ